MMTHSRQELDAKECERLRQIARADNCKKVYRHGDVTFIFTRKDKTNDARFMLDNGQYSDNEADYGAKVCGKRLDKMRSTSQVIYRFRSVKLKDGTELEVPEDFDETEKTVSERFDAIRDAVLAVNTDMLRVPDRRHTCQIWTKARSTSNDEVNIISEEDWTPQKFVYRANPANNIVVVLKLLPDQNGKGGGQEIMMTARELEDAFPDLHHEINTVVSARGFRSWNALNAEIKSLTGGRSEFQRALVEMTDKTLTGARSEAAKEAVAQKAGFYESREGYGMF